MVTLSVHARQPKMLKNSFNFNFFIDLKNKNLKTTRKNVIWAWSEKKRQRRWKRWNDMQITSLNQSEKCEKQIIKLILRWLIYGDFFISFLDFHFFYLFASFFFFFSAIAGPKCFCWFFIIFRCVLLSSLKMFLIV